MTANGFEAKLKEMRACHEAREWAKGKTLAEAWATCERGDWLLWLAGRSGVERKAVVLAACACARLALKHVPSMEGRPLRAIETAEAWARGVQGVSLDDVRKAARAASSAAYAASYAASAAYAAASSASSAASYAASAASYASYAASYASYARATALKECAGLVRAHVPAEAVQSAMEDA